VCKLIYDLMYKMTARGHKHKGESNKQTTVSFSLDSHKACNLLLDARN